MITTMNLTQSEIKIATEIVAHANNEGSNKNLWYVGIASDPRKRLFEEHNVQKENAWWIYRDAGSSDSARKIETYLIETYGFDGGSGGGDYTTKFVYAYRKTHQTNP